MTWRVYKVTEEYRELMNDETGQLRKVMLASDKQWEYLESLRHKHGKTTPLATRPTTFHASKQIDKYLKKDSQTKLPL